MNLTRHLIVGLCAIATACSSAAGGDHEVSPSPVRASHPSHPYAFERAADGSVSTTTHHRRALPGARLRLEATISSDYRDGFQVATSARPDAWAKVRPLAATAAEAPTVSDDGAEVRAPGAYGRAHATLTGTESRVEEFVTVPDADSLPALRYRIEPGPRLGEWVEEDGHLWAFADDGEPLFMIPPPSALDAQHTLYAGSWRVSRPDHRTLDLSPTFDIGDMRGVKYPLVIDPAFETPQWFNGSNGTVPAARGAAGIAYRTSDGCVLIFGGATGANTLPFYSNTLFKRCSGSWSSADATTGSTRPSTRGYVAMTYAPLSSGTGTGVYAFGGYTDTTPAVSDQFYRLDSSNAWHAIAKSGSWPAPRYLAGLAWNGTALVLFGGVDSSGANLTDTWTFDGTSWTQLSTTMSGRYGFAPATDGSGNVYAFGGYDGSVLTYTVQRLLAATGTWETDISPADAQMPTTSSGALSGCNPYTGACDTLVRPDRRYTSWASLTPAGNLLTGAGLTFNGTSVVYQSDAWVLMRPSDTVTVPQWERSLTTTVTDAGPRESAMAILDTARNELVLFGGMSSSAEIPVAAPRVYRGRSDTVSMTITCSDGDADGVCATPGTDHLVLAASISLSGTGTPQGYFTQHSASAGTWAQITSASCGTVSTPLSGSSISCTIPYPALDGTGSLTVDEYGVRARDKNVAAGSATCSSTLPGNETTVICDSVAYSGMQVCTGFDPYFLNNGDQAAVCF